MFSLLSGLYHYTVAASTESLIRTISISFIMQLVTPFILGLACLIRASANLESESAGNTELAVRCTDGYRSVAYFVNWVSSPEIAPA